MNDRTTSATHALTHLSTQLGRASAMLSDASLERLAPRAAQPIDPALAQRLAARTEAADR